ncbi:unnamed protein product [Lupinus luteus]|uniref:Transmembrane protein n=1 Tax=Lupinus luteus TaxID=3873 RepID=A0AAV1YIQ0_LUPLU
MNNLVVLILLLLPQKLLVVEGMTHESEAPVPHGVEDQNEKSDRIAEHHPVSEGNKKSSQEKGKSEASEAPQNGRVRKHHSVDKSVAGGGVIIAGLVTAIFASVFCYIRVTRKRVHTPCSSSSLP